MAPKRPVKSKKRVPAATPKRRARAAAPRSSRRKAPLGDEAERSAVAPDEQERLREASSDLVIVGVGASAGGLDAFSNLLQALPPNPGFAIVFVQHLAPQHESALPVLLSA